MGGIASKGQLRMSFLRWAAVTVPAVILLGFLSGSVAPAGSENAWYVALRKPAATPPGWVFPVAWTTLYALMGLALADSFVAMIKVALERRAEKEDERVGRKPATSG